MRAGNPHLAEMYHLRKMMLTAQGMWKIHTQAEIEPDHPVVGSRAYRGCSQKSIECPGDMVTIKIQSHLHAHIQGVRIEPCIALSLDGESASLNHT